MRLLYLADIRFPLDRANGIQTIETCYAVAERGHEVILLVRPDTAARPRDPFAYYGLAPARRLHIDRVRVAGPEPLRRATYVARAVAAIVARRHSVDVVMTRDLMVAACAVRLPRAIRAPLVYESHGLATVFAETRPDMLTGGARASRWKLRRLSGRERRVWRGAEGYVTITDLLRADLTSEFGPRPNVAVVPDGVRIPPERHTPASVQSASPLIVYAGHLYPWKGVDVLLRAVALVPNARAVIAGGHPAEHDVTRLKALAAELGIDHRVTFTGFVSRASIPALLATADVLVMPHTSTPISDRYASPLKLFEYMAAGRPIVASDLLAVREVLRDGENACLAPAGNAEALAAAITRVTADTALAEQIGRRAFDEAAGYSWARRAERLEAVLQGALSG